MGPTNVLQIHISEQPDSAPTEAYRVSLTPQRSKRTREHRIVKSASNIMSAIHPSIYFKQQHKQVETQQMCRHIIQKEDAQKETHRESHRGTKEYIYIDMLCAIVRESQFRQ